jgi:hypothetical protein
MAFVTGKVSSPRALRTNLLFGTGNPVRVWLNGKEVFKGEAGKAPARPDQVSVNVELKEGTNVLLIQVTYRGDKAALYARLRDPERKLRYPETDGK